MNRQGCTKGVNKGVNNDVNKGVGTGVNRGCGQCVNSPFGYKKTCGRIEYSCVS